MVSPFGAVGLDRAVNVGDGPVGLVRVPRLVKLLPPTKAPGEPPKVNFISGMAAPVLFV